MTNMTKDEIKALQIKAAEISDLWKDSDFDDIDEVAAEFEGRFAGFCQKKSAN